MGKRGGLFFAIAALIMTAIIWGNPIPRIKAAFFPKIPSLVPISQSVTALELSVDEAQLMAHVKAIAQPRTTAPEKSAARQYITEQLTKYGLTFEQQPYHHPGTGAVETGGVNIVTTLPGNDPNASTFVLGAHYDTPANVPGADDNGSAIAALLETVRLLTPVMNPLAAANPFPHTLKLVFFDQEEQQPDGSGLLGSLAFTQEPTNIANVEGAVILDMIGYACRTEGCQRYPQGLPTQTLPTTGDFLAVLGLSTHTDLIGAFMGSATTTWPLVLSLPIPKTTLSMFPDLMRSDHAPFWEKEIPAVFVTDTANFRNANYHTQKDTPETLDPSFFRGSAQHVVNAVTTLLSQS
ncbi:MAG: M28 family peptidase [Cyanobacteria bacterium J06598_3]